MANTDELKQAVGCLSLVFPQFVAKELATLTDQILTAVQSFTDPLGAIGDLNLDSLVNDVAALSQLDAFGAISAVAVGLGVQYVKREGDDIISDMAAEYPNVTKRVQEIRNLSGKVVNTVGTMMSLFPDMPYAAAQRMCQTIIETADLKARNLACLRKHIVQLMNTILILGKSTSNYKDETFEDIAAAIAKIKTAQSSLTLSQRLHSGTVTFDSQAFERARQALLDASALLTPDKNGTTVLDVVDILAFGSVEAADVTKVDRKLTLLVIPSLIALIEAEVMAVVSQVQVINYYVQQLAGLIANFRRVGQASRIQEQRARAISGMQTKLTNLVGRMELALERQSLRAASGEMLLWSSRVKTIIASMNQVKELTLQEGSVEGPDKAFELQQAFQQLLLDLTAIANPVTVAGIENPLPLRDQVLALTKAATRVVKDLEEGRATESKLATLHGLAFVVAQNQASRIEQSITVASLQKVACEKFTAIDLQFGERYDQMLDSMRQLGLDRGVDMLSSGAFEEFLSSDLQQLSYLGTVITCLAHGINGTDDVQTRQQLTDIREDLIGKRSNQEIAAADSSDQGRTRFIDDVKSKISAVQRNAKTIESIVTDLKGLLTAAGESIDQSLDGLAQYNAFLANVDQLAVAAGGRLAAGLEEFSEHPKAGVVACDAV